jgi:hypothetical protein
MDEICVMWSEYKGHRYLDIRVYTEMGVTLRIPASWVPNPLGLFLASPDALQCFALLSQQSRQFPQHRPRAPL